MTTTKEILPDSLGSLSPVFSIQLCYVPFLFVNILVQVLQVYIDSNIQHVIDHCSRGVCTQCTHTLSLASHVLTISPILLLFVLVKNCVLLCILCSHSSILVHITAHPSRYSRFSDYYFLEILLPNLQKLDWSTCWSYAVLSNFTFNLIEVL